MVGGVGVDVITVTGRTGVTLREVLPPGGGTGVTPGEVLLPGGGVSVLVLLGLVLVTRGTTAVVVVVEITAWG